MDQTWTTLRKDRTMASIFFDKSTGWWNVKFYAGPVQGRIKKPLCKHPGEWSKVRPPRRPPPLAVELAVKFQEMERRAKLGIEEAAKETPLRPYLDAYCERAAHSLRPRTMLCIRNACRKFAAYCGARKVTTVQAVTRVVCREWLSSRLAEGAERSTVVTERSNLRPIWAQAEDDRIVLENPWEREKVPGRARREIPTAWTPEEVEKLVGVADGWLRDLILLGVNTGIRINALLGLRWSQIDWDAGLIRVRAKESKSGRPYHVPMTPVAHDILGRMDLANKGDSPLLFENPETGKPYASRTTYTRIGRLVAKAGITDYGDYNHVMRRTFATVALNSGVSMEVVQRCLGHASMAITEKSYAHLTTKRLKEGMAGFSLGGGSIGLPAPVPPQQEAPSRSAETSSEPATSPSSGSGGRRKGGSKSSPPSP